MSQPQKPVKNRIQTQNTTEKMQKENADNNHSYQVNNSLQCQVQSTY